MFPSVVGQESEEAQAAKKAEFPARPAPELVAKIAEAGGWVMGKERGLEGGVGGGALWRRRL